MAKYDFRTQRLYVEANLAATQEIEASREQAHYLRNVLRLEEGSQVLLFNGRDGEWLASAVLAGKRGLRLRPERQSRPQFETFGPVYAFAPLKQARLDYTVQKAVEMGVSRLSPVITQHTQVTRLNQERMQANAIEAAEQSGILEIPQIDAPLPFERWCDSLEAGQAIVFCDEDGEGAPLETLQKAPERGLVVLVGPEGGFSERERETLLARKNVIRLSLGPRILRADTAAVAALALVQSARGDWR